MRLVDTQTELEVVDMYVNQGLSGQQILERVAAYKTKKSIYDLLRRYGVDTRDSKTMKDPGLDHTFFSDINSQEKGYILGLMISDGWVTRAKNRSPQVSFSLTEADGRLVAWVANQWGTKHTPTVIHKDDCKPMLRCTVTSGKMYEDLKELGVDERKSLVSVFPNVEASIVPHVLRGIFDGDGCAHVHEDTDQTHIVFSGTLSLVGQIAWILKESIGTTYVKPSSTGKNTFATIRFSKKEDVKAIYDFMYFDCSICLERKRDKIEDNFD